MLPDGRTDETFRFDGGSNGAAFRGPVRSTCCPAVYVTVTSVAGQTARIGGRAFPLDQPGARAAGALTLDLPERAEVAVFAASVTIRRR